MEKHIFRFGSSSMGIVLPKKWLVKQKLDSGSQIVVSENSKGELVLAAQKQLSRTMAVPVSRKTEGELLARWVSVYYMYGVGKLTMVSQDGFTEDQVSAVEKIMKEECPGFEIITQSSTEIKIEDLTDVKEIDPDKIILRLYSLLQQEFSELAVGNYKTIGRLEELIDRFYMLGIRYVNMVQPADTIKYYRTIQLLELIGDHLLALFEHGVKPKYKRIFEKLDKASKLLMDSFNGDEAKITEIADIRKAIVKEVGGPHTGNQEDRMLREIATFTSQIAELGLLHKNEEQPLL